MVVNEHVSESAAERSSGRVNANEQIGAQARKVNVGENKHITTFAISLSRFSEASFCPL